MALAERAELIARLSLKDEFSSKLAGAEKGLKGFASNTSASLGRAGQNLERFAAVGIGAVVGAVGASVKVAADFESSLNTINTIARASPEALGKIGDAIRQVARDTGTPLEDLTQGYYDLLSAGIKAADATKVLTAANTLAIGGLSSTAEAIDLLTSAINTYGGDAGNAAKFSDVFAKAIERGKVTAAEIAASFSQVGSIAASSGLEIEEIGATFARLTSAGVPAAEAVTQMRSAIVALTKRTGPLEALEKQTGKSYLSIAGEKGLVSALEQMRIDAEKAGVPLVDLLGRVEGLNFTLLTTGTNFDAYNADLKAMGDASGTAAGQMAERQKGLNFQLDRLRALAKDAGITIGSALLPKLTPLVEKFADFIAANPEGIAAFGGAVAGAFQSIADAASKVDWAAIGGGLEITGRAAKLLVDAFLALPPDIQKLAVAAIAINKVGGGIITSGLKDIAGLVLGNLRTINAAQVTVVGGSVAGGGAAGAASKAGGAFGTIATIGSVVIAAASIAALAQVFMEQNANSTAQAAAIKDGLDASITGKTMPQLLTAQQGVKEGIDKIQSNPLLVLVQGDALNTLKTMSQQLHDEVAIRSAQVVSADRQTERISDVANNQAIGNALLGAVRDKPWETTVNTNVVVNSAVSVSAVTAAQAFVKTYETTTLNRQTTSRT